MSLYSGSRARWIYSFALDFLLWFLACISLSVAFHLVLQPVAPFSIFEDSLFSVILSLNGSTAWENLRANTIANLLLLGVLFVVQLLLLSRWIAVAVQALSEIKLGFIERSRGALRGALQKVLPANMRFGPLVEPSTFRRYLPGLYYRVILPNQEFAKRVSSLQQADSTMGQQKESKKERNTDPRSQREVLQSVVLDLKSRVEGMGSEVEKDSMELTSRMTDVRHILLHINHRVSSNS